MSVLALKEEAARQFAFKVESPDDAAALAIVPDFLKGIEAGHDYGINLPRHYAGIKFKNGTVLEKLAK